MCSLIVTLNARLYLSNGHMKFMEDIFYAVRNVLSAVLNACLQKFV